MQRVPPFILYLVLSYGYILLEVASDALLNQTVRNPLENSAVPIEV